MPPNPVTVRTRIAFDADTWYALDRLGKDSMKTIQELTDEEAALTTGMIA